MASTTQTQWRLEKKDQGTVWAQQHNDQGQKFIAQQNKIVDRGTKRWKHQAKKAWHIQGKFRIKKEISYLIFLSYLEKINKKLRKWGISETQNA